MTEQDSGTPLTGRSLRRRVATAADREKLRAVHDAGRRQLVAALPADLAETVLQQQFEARRAGWGHAADAVIVTVIELDAAVVGWVVVADRPDERRIVDVEVAPEVRGQGLGERVLRSLVGEAAGSRIVLHVEHGNPARRLYERLGFREEARDEVRARMVLPAVR